MEETRENLYPLTALQQGMVYHSLLAPESGVYVQQLVAHLQETLKIACFKEAWRRVVARHAVLRTRFRMAGTDEFLQEVAADAAPEWTEDDWSSLSPDDRQTRWELYLAEDRRRGFDFAQAPLMRLALFRIADDHHLFLWTYYHALLDGRSQFRVLKELFGSYEALCAGEEYRGEDCPPFRDFARWLNGRDFGGARDFWREALRDFAAPTRVVVACESAHPADNGDDHGSQKALLTEEETRTLRSFAAENDVTVGTLVQASWAALIGRYSGGEDVVFGATRACRHSSVEGAESMVGLLINTIPLRVRLTSDTPVVEWLKMIRSQWVAMRRYEHTPLGDIQAWSDFGPKKPLFDNILVFEDYSFNEALRAQGGGWTRRQFQLLEKGNYPLAALAYGGSRLLLRLGYDRARFDDAAAARMLGHWRGLLVGLTENPQRRVADLPLLTPGERRTLLVDWNSTQREYPHDMCLHQLVEAQAARTPDKPAVLFEDERLTYDELNTRANRLAHHLQDLGAAPETRIAVCLNRTPVLPVSVLAVLKAGGAYVPLDPEYPKEQMSAMLADSGASLLLTESRLLDRLPSHDLRTVCVDADSETIEREGGVNPSSGVSPANLAYAMYTSGSTGRPKLIGVEHRSAVNAVFYTTQVVFNADDLAVVPFVDSICFDPSIYRMFSPLSVGGSIVVLDSPFSLPDSRWADSITALGCAPSVMKALLKDFALPESVKVVTVGAEAASDDLLERLAGYPHIDRVINFYGPTETTIYCSHAVLMERRGGSPEARRASPLARTARPNVIGKPIANARMYVLDERLRPVPIGVTGELCVGGVCLARGYLNQPDSTAEKFIPDPFSDDDQDRLYKTGDLARFLPDGNIEFMGRIDSQVKIHGFRVEPQGIEAALNEHEAVRESVVRALEGPSGEKHLVAYVARVSREGSGTAASAPITAGGLRGYLERKLPRYTVPLAFVVLDELPRTSRGKLDYSALPEPALESGAPKRSFVPARTGVETALAGIWREVLAVEAVGVNDDFLELGGDSLSAMRIVNRVNHAFGAQFSVGLIFDAPTVAGLARVVSGILPGGSATQDRA